MITENEGKKGPKYICLLRELEKMLAEDVSEYGRSRLRRYEQELQQTADWFTATDDYYRLVKENYMACYDHLTGLAETLRAALGAEE